MPREENLECGWSYGWCFTWNNPPDDCKERLETLINTCDPNYIIAGDEVAPTTGTPHIQGYIHWKYSVSFAQVKSFIPQAHWKRAFGNKGENKKYCSKESVLLEYGAPPRPGTRTDIIDVKRILTNGGTMKDVVLHTNSYQAAKFGELFLKYASPAKRNWIPTVTWIWGPTGSGKTRKAFAEAKDPWVSGKNLEWWEGYYGQSDIIIDDFRGDFCTFHELLRILDRYEYRVMIKGSSQQLLAKNIWITSCYPPDKVYTSNKENIKQLLRRITTIIYMNIDKIELEDDYLTEILSADPFGPDG